MSIKKSFSLIEVLVFITILSVFLVISAAIITISMRQNMLKVNMLKATHYNEQLLEWIRSEKETEWSTFASNAGNATYCFNSDSFSWGNDCTIMLGDIYKRYADFVTTLVHGTPTQVVVTVRTEWQEAGNTYSTKLHTLFTLWEE